MNVHESLPPYHHLQKRDWFMVAAICALALSFILLFQHSRTHAGIDFHQFWAVSLAAGETDADIYAEDTRRSLAIELQRRAEDPTSRESAAAHFRDKLDPTATPLLYTCFTPLAYLEYESAHATYSLVILIAFLAAILMMCVHLSFPLPFTLCAAAALPWLYQPFLSDLSVGNVNALQLLGVAFILILESRRSTANQVTSGLLLALLVLFKPNLASVPLLLGAAYLFRRDWPGAAALAAGAVAGIAIGLTLPIAYFAGANPWMRWLSASGQMHQWFDASVAAGNYALTALLGMRLWLPLTLLATVAALWALWTASRNASPMAFTRIRLLAIAAGCVLPLVTAPLAWLHYFVLLLPALFYSISPIALRNPVPLLVAGILSVPALLAFAGAEPPPGFIALLFILAALALFVLILYRLSKIPQEPASHSAPSADPSATPGRAGRSPAPGSPR